MSDSDTDTDTSSRLGYRCCRRTSLVMPLYRVWWLSLPFRLMARTSGSGFAPGLRNLVQYEKARLGYALYERDQLLYRWLRVRAWWSGQR